MNIQLLQEHAGTEGSFDAAHAGGQLTSHIYSPKDQNVSELSGQIDRLNEKLEQRTCGKSSCDRLFLSYLNLSRLHASMHLVYHNGTYNVSQRSFRML